MKHPVPVTPLRAPALLQVTVAWVRVSRRGVCVPGHRSGSGGAGAIELLGRWEPGDAISGGGRTRLSICGYLQDRPGTTDEGTGRPGTPDEGTGRPRIPDRGPAGRVHQMRGPAGRVHQMRGPAGRVATSARPAASRAAAAARPPLGRAITVG